jgi:superoxide dismutase, Fe-Mn family
MADNRRDFLRKTALLGLGGFAATVVGKENLELINEHAHVLSGGGNVTLPALPYAYDALEPYIDRQTMEIHHGKHHKAYIDKLNTAPEKEIDLTKDVAENCRKVDKQTSDLVRNNLGGHYNHMLFWQLLEPNKGGQANIPAGKLAEAINKDFKSFEDFKKEFSDKAAKHFGSGWCWLVKDGGKLKIACTPNQDNPLMKVAEQKGDPVLGLDVWEHAYYLKYQNKRADYISGWWNIINWKKAEELYTK